MDKHQQCRQKYQNPFKDIGDGLASASMHPSSKVKMEV